MNPCQTVCFVTAVGGHDRPGGGFLTQVFPSHSDALWGRTARARPLLLDYSDPQLGERIQESALIVVDCTGELAREARTLWERSADLRSKMILCSGSEPRRALIPGAPRPVAPPVLENKLLEKFPPETSFAEVYWDEADPDLRVLMARIQEQVGLTLEKFFPDRNGVAHIHSVGGGMSGTPLFRVAIEGESGDYFVKLFAEPGEFRQEWANHERARQWLGPHAVPLRAIPMWGRDPDSQLAAFPGTKPSNVDTPHRVLPICYAAAKSATTFKDLYQSNEPEDLSGALAGILAVLQPEYNDDLPSRQALTTLLDYGPGRWNRPAQQRMIESLRSTEYHYFITDSRRRLADYWRLLQSHVAGLDLSSLEDFLRTNQPWAAEFVPLVRGHVHGDANSRNFILPRSIGLPRDVQFIDCGGYENDAPRLFDLAQMEADMKVLLLGSEAGAPGFRDIDTGAVLEWCVQEQLAVASLSPFAMLAGATTSTTKAYSLIRLIRSRAANLSPGDPEGRAYFFFLLYWTLRKLRHADFPHVKRMLALVSAATICTNMGRWRRP